MNLRKEKLYIRDRLSQVKRKTKSSLIQQKIYDLKDVQRANCIFMYINFRSEVETMDLLEKCIEEDKKVVVPITYVDKKRMDAVQITHIQNDLQPGYCGILEPTDFCCKNKTVDPSEIDVVIIPGSVFDERGGRYGYGGGYYDKFLTAIPEALRVGAAFDIQVEKKITLQKHDQLLDYVITESRTITLHRKRMK